MTAPDLTVAQLDRAAGALIGLACGDALGAPYEFQPPRGPELPVAMVGGGSFGWAPGEWTDDTSMAIAIAELAAEGADLTSEATLDRLVGRWVEWARDATDVGIQTRRVLAAVERAPTAANARAEALAVHIDSGRSGGNGSLMRTAPVALAMLGRPAREIAAVARSISVLTHHDPEAGDACVLWCLAIDHAVRTGQFDVRVGLDEIPESRRTVWRERIREAETKRPVDFGNNGWVVHAFQAAWSAIATTPIPRDAVSDGQFACEHFQHALDRAVRAGNDTDTVAAIAGALLGARWGRSAVPFEWWRVLHGWPGLRARDLLRLAVLAARRGANDSHGWPSVSRMDYTEWGRLDADAVVPATPNVCVGGVALLNDPQVTVVVSLCRLGVDEVPARGVDAENHIEFWLIDRAADDNPNLAFVLNDAARCVRELSGTHDAVLVHCVAAESRSPIVATLAGQDPGGFASAWVEMRDVLPTVLPKSALFGTAQRLQPVRPEAQEVP